ncbi:MAG: arylsulfatase [Candidatus Hydrogenedentes bacterium]|nr:arylsulfatase [Candidatus Hydrogenedentota bacterium]
MNRREWLRTAGAAAGGSLLAAGCAGTTDAAENAQRPNIIFILADDLGYGDLGCYGQKVIQTPNIDRMASEGIRFTQCYAGSTVCAPSRCALMTGLHTGHCWIRGNQRVPLRPTDVTVAKVLKDAGYATGLMGKWGLGNEDTTGIPNLQGFDEFFGYLDQGHAHNYYPEFLWRNQEKVALEGNVESPTDKGVAVEKKVYSHDLIAQEALDFIERRHKEPFFLYLAMTTPHANNEAGRVLGDGMEVPDYGPYADKPWPNPEKGRAAMITRMDRDVGRVLDKLKELGIDGNTLVFFTSDNGPHMEGGADPEFFDDNGPLRGIKRDLYEGGIRVPMIARWPGQLLPGLTSEHVWTFWDFSPTAAEVAGTKAPEGLDGMSMMQAFRLLGAGGVKRMAVQHEYLYWEFHEGGIKQAVRHGDWKAVRLGIDQPLELYDLTKDVGETTNVADQHPDIVEHIETYLQTARTDNEHWPLKA